MNYSSSNLKHTQPPGSLRQSRLYQRRSELVSRGKNALLTMLERGIFSSVMSVRVTHELGSETPFLLSVTGETAGVTGESVFNERFSSFESAKDFAAELSDALFPKDQVSRGTFLFNMSNWSGSIGTSVRIYPV